MSAAPAFGKINVKLLNSDQESFIEQPFYTSYNFLQDDQTDAANKSTLFFQAIGGFITDLSDNTVTEMSVTYEVQLGS